MERHYKRGVIAVCGQQLNPYLDVNVSLSIIYFPEFPHFTQFGKAQIFNKPFLTVQEGKDKGTPFRTTKGGVWQNGYGDHYPTMIYLIRKK